MTKNLVIDGYQKAGLMVHGQSLDCSVPKGIEGREGGSIKEAREREIRRPGGWAESFAVG